MNINGKLDLYKNSLGQLRLSNKSLASMSAKTTVMTEGEKSVLMNFNKEQQNQQMLEKKNSEKVIERDPLKLLKTY